MNFVRSKKLKNIFLPKHPFRTSNGVKSLLSLVFIFMLCTAMPLGLAHAQSDQGLDCSKGPCTYVPLEPLPGVTPPDSSGDLTGYLSGIITLLIIIGSMLAVANFSIGGLIYLTSTSAGKRQAASSRMWACIYGVLLLISSVLILQTINPDLVKINLSSLGKLSALGGGSANTNVIPNCDPKTTNCSATGL